MSRLSAAERQHNTAAPTTIVVDLPGERLERVAHAIGSDDLAFPAGRRPADANMVFEQDRAFLQSAGFLKDQPIEWRLDPPSRRLAIPSEWHERGLTKGIE